MHRIVSSMVVAVAISSAASAAVADPLARWSGAYVGINGGYGGDTFNYTAAGVVASSSPGSFNARLSQSSGGFVAGAQVGLNFEVGDGWIVGGEADIDGATIQANNKLNFNVVQSGSQPGTATGAGQIGSQIDALGTVRLRVGHPIFENRFMPYVSAGLAYGWVVSSVRYSYASSIAPPSSGAGKYSGGMIQVGWTAGVGADYALTERLSFRAEYLYADLGAFSVSTRSPMRFRSGDILTGRASRSADANLVRMGLNYRF